MTKLRRFVVVPLILAFIAQSLLPIQLHSRLVRGADGIVVTMCTHEGIKTVVMSLGGESAEDTARSAAMVFSDLLLSAVNSDVNTQPGWLVFIETEHSADLIAGPAPTTTKAHFIRGPPIFS